MLSYFEVFVFEDLLIIVSPVICVSLFFVILSFFFLLSVECFLVSQSRGVEVLVSSFVLLVLESLFLISILSHFSENRPRTVIGSKYLMFMKFVFMTSNLNLYR